MKSTLAQPDTSSHHPKGNQHKKQQALCFVERLTPRVWLLHLFPYLLCKRFKAFHGQQKVFYFDASLWGGRLASLTKFLGNYTVDQLRFRLVNIKDEKGNLIRIRIEHLDLNQAQKDILADPIFQEALQSEEIQKQNAGLFLAKQTTPLELTADDTLWRMLFRIQVADWKRTLEGLANAECDFFIFRRLWMGPLARYAHKYRIRLIPVFLKPMSITSKITDLVGYTRLKAMFYFVQCFGFWEFLLQCVFLKKNIVDTKKNFPPDVFSPLSRPKLMVDYYGQLNLEEPHLHSDLFFWQKSKIKGENILVSFSIPKDPLDETKWQILKKHGMSAVVLNPRASKIPAPVFHHWPKISRIRFPRFTLDKVNPSPERRWIESQMKTYYQELDYWTNLFIETNTKVHITWYKFIGQHSVIANALRTIGGISASYQRSFEEFSAVVGATNVDVAFAFSPMCAAFEKESNSRIPYHISVGYMGDYRFEAVKEYASRVRSHLMRNGARKILAYFDEGSNVDARWHTGHEFMRVNYDFLFNKVLETPWLGLVLKPKTPATLRQRLGEHLSDLLDRVKQTGRCYIFEGGALQGCFPPCVAAKACDIAIHGHLCSGTAGIESALSGAPTILLDREGWPMGYLHKLEDRKVVFYDWESLWKACLENWEIPGGIPGFGDWSPIIDELDPFRDGRAAQRVGTFLQWIMEGYEAKLPRETILADAAERYARAWGKDKINRIGEP